MDFCFCKFQQEADDVENLMDISGPSWAIARPSWNHLRPTWAILEPWGAFLEPSWAPSWVILEPSCDHLRQSWSHSLWPKQKSKVFFSPKQKSNVLYCLVAIGEQRRFCRDPDKIFCKRLASRITFFGSRLGAILGHFWAHVLKYLRLIKQSILKNMKLAPDKKPSIGYFGQKRARSPRAAWTPMAPSEQPLSAIG